MLGKKEKAEEHQEFYQWGWGRAGCVLEWPGSLLAHVKEVSHMESGGRALQAMGTASAKGKHWQVLASWGNGKETSVTGVVWVGESVIGELVREAMQAWIMYGWSTWNGELLLTRGVKWEDLHFKRISQTAGSEHMERIKGGWRETC